MFLCHILLLIKIASRWIWTSREYLFTRHSKAEVGVLRVRREADVQVDVSPSERREVFNTKSLNGLPSTVC